MPASSPNIFARPDGVKQELAASKARLQEMGRHNATEAEHFCAICRRIDDWVSIMTTGHAALSDKTNG
jgi:hypothetical protein